MARVAESIRRYSTFFKKHNVTNVLDYGTGTMRNTHFLADQGFTVYAADLPEQVVKLRNCPATRSVERLLTTAGQIISSVARKTAEKTACCA